MLKRLTPISISTPSADVVHVTNPNVYTTTSTSDTANIPANFVVADKSKANDKKLENAVYTYFRSLKTVGRQSIGVEEVASALGLSIKQTKDIVVRLRNLGARLEG